MTRPIPSLLGFLVLALPLLGQELVGRLEFRYRIEFNLERFPQKKPQEALESVVKAVGEKRYDYFLAQMSLPGQVDPRVLRIAETYSKGSLDEKKQVAFEEVTRLTAEHFRTDPVLLKELRQFAAGAEWGEEKDDRIVATHKELPGRKLTFHKLENRWFLDNRQK